MTLLLILLGLGSLVISLLGALVVRRAAPRLGLIDLPSGRKDHPAPTPLGGGAAIYAAFWVPVWVGVAGAAALAAGWGAPWAPERLRELAAGVPSVRPRLAAIFAGATVIAAVGLADDWRKLSVWARLAVQFLAALVVFLAGVRVTLFYESRLISGVITVAWLVVLTNSFNWLDNMDGLAGGIGWIISAILLAVSVQTSQLFLAAALAALMGALGGFLVFNWPPATLFMGDCGGMHLGFLLGALSAEFTFYGESSLRPLFPIVVPLLIFAVPLYDMISVILIRLYHGRPIHQADHSHFSHRLVALGMSRAQAVLTIYLVTLALGLGATGLYHSTTGGTVVAFIQALALIAIIVVLERAPKKEKS